MTTTAPPSMDAEAIWRDLHGPLLGFIARRVPDPETAEDILQEMMLRIHRYGAQGSAPESITAWLYGVARNAITDHYRRAVVRRERPSGTYLDFRETEAPLDPHPAEAHLELAKCLTPLLQRLPPSYRDALQLTDLDGLTQAEAAARAGLSLSGMKSRVQRGRGQLKGLLEQCCEIVLDPRRRVVEAQPRTGPSGCHSEPSSEHSCSPPAPSTT